MRVINYKCNCADVLRSTKNSIAVNAPVYQRLPTVKVRILRITNSYKKPFLLEKLLNVLYLLSYIKLNVFRG